MGADLVKFVRGNLFEIWMMFKCELLFVSGDQSGTGVDSLLSRKET